MKTTITNQKNNFKRLAKVLGIAALICLGLKANAQQQCIANFTYADSANTGNVIFTNTASIGNSPLTYLWDFGDGTTSNLENPTHLFANNGTYNTLVCLTIADSNGITCIHCDSVVIGGYTGVSCQANFYTIPDSNSANGINFWNNSGGTPTSFFWDFGDNTTSSQQNPNHIYADSGTYNVCLTIIDSANNCQNTFCQSVVAGHQNGGGCQAYFYSYADSSSTNSINFLNYSSGASTNYSWNFGDSTTSTLANPHHIYANTGTYQVCLSISDSIGVTCSYCEYVVVGNQNNGGCQANFYYYSDSSTSNSINFSNYSGGTQTIFSWNFGDSTSSNLENPNHVFANAGTYQVCLSISDSTGVTCSYCEYVVVGKQNGGGCQAYFYSYSDSSSANSINFWNYSSGASTNFSWDFGDNTASSLENPNHVYALAGTYNVCLTIGDSSGATCSYCSSVVIGNGGCLANFYSYADSTSTNSIYFTSYSGGGNASYFWNFGDNTTSTLENPNHIYTNTGIYHVCLTIADSSGSTCTHCDSVVVGNQSVSCHANYSLVTDSTDVNFIWVYDYSTCGNNGNGNCSYLWDFGDGTSSTMQYFTTHNYTGNGPFNLCLTVSDGNGCNNTHCDSIYLGRSSAGITLGIKNPLAGINESKNVVTLLENYPNPFNGSTTINYSVSKNSEVELNIVDLMGNKIAAVESGNKSAGTYSTVWNVDNVASGLYLLQLKINNQITTKKIIINK